MRELARLGKFIKADLEKAAELEGRRGQEARRHAPGAAPGRAEEAAKARGPPGPQRPGDEHQRADHDHDRRQGPRPDPARAAEAGPSRAPDDARHRDPGTHRHAGGSARKILERLAERRGRGGPTKEAKAALGGSGSRCRGPKRHSPTSGSARRTYLSGRLSLRRDVLERLPRLLGEELARRGVWLKTRRMRSRSASALRQRNSATPRTSSIQLAIGGSNASSTPYTLPAAAHTGTSRRAVAELLPARRRPRRGCSSPWAVSGCTSRRAAPIPSPATAGRCASAPR